MKNTIPKILVRPSLVILLGLPLISNAQSKLFDIGGGFNLKHDTSGAFDFSLSFNRVEIDDPGSKDYLKWDYLNNRNVFFKPSVEANIGSSPETSPNNILADLAFIYSSNMSTLPRGWTYQVALKPTASADKNFDTGLLFASLEPKAIYTFNNDTVELWAIIQPIGYDRGYRAKEEMYPTVFHRAVQKLKGGISICPKVTDASANDYYYRLKWEADFTLYNIWNDTTVIANGSYGFLKTSLTYMFSKRLGISAKYTVGHEQPKFEKIHTLLFGLSIYSE
jgi:hypothetical protein